jgi:hypothetical protein
VLRKNTGSYMSLVIATHRIEAGTLGQNNSAEQCALRLMCRKPAPDVALFTGNLSYEDAQIIVDNLSKLAVNNSIYSDKKYRIFDCPKEPADQNIHGGLVGVISLQAIRDNRLKSQATATNIDLGALEIPGATGFYVPLIGSDKKPIDFVGINFNETSISGYNFNETLGRGYPMVVAGDFNSANQALDRFSLQGFKENGSLPAPPIHILTLGGLGAATTVDFNYSYTVV